MSLSNFAELELLDHTLQVAAYTPPATVYLSLHTADPTEVGTGAEASYTGYARKAITFGAAASRVVTQSGVVTLDQCTAGSDTVTHYGIWDAAVAGNILAYGALLTSKDIVVGNTPSVSSGETVLTFDAGGYSDYLANKLLDFMFRNQAFTAPTVYVALTTAVISDANTGSTITEASGGSYARKAHAAWDTAVAGASANSSAITFAAATASWGTVVAAALLDASTAGNMLLYDNDAIVDQLVDSPDVVEFATGAFDVTLN